MQNWVKKQVLFLGSFFLFIFSLLGAEPLTFKIRGEAGILMNAETGVVLFEHQSNLPFFPASTTKIATALYALKLRGEDLGLMVQAEQEILVTQTQEAKRKSKHTLPPYLLEPDGMHIGIKKDEILSLRTLLEGMLIPSGNDAANVIAHALGPTIPLFMDGLNAFVKEIGCENTRFLNPHGLHDPLHQTTAKDLAVLTSKALKNPVFCEIVSQTRFSRPKTNKQPSATFLQTNRLLRPGKYYYAKAIGVKTGYHAKAKKTFVGAARSDGRTLIAVLLGYEDRNAIFEDAAKLFETAFNQPKVQRVFFKEGPQNFKLELPQANGSIQTHLLHPLTLEYYSAEDPKVKCHLYWHSLSLPVMKDQEVGELHLISAKGELLKRGQLLSIQEVGLTWPHNWLAYFSSIPTLWILIGLLGLVLIVWFWKKR